MQQGSSSYSYIRVSIFIIKLVKVFPLICGVYSLSRKYHSYLPIHTLLQVSFISTYKHIVDHDYDHDDDDEHANCHDNDQDHDTGHDQVHDHDQNGHYNNDYTVQILDGIIHSSELYSFRTYEPQTHRSRSLDPLP